MNFSGKFLENLSNSHDLYRIHFSDRDKLSITTSPMQQTIAYIQNFFELRAEVGPELGFRGPSDS